MNTTMSNGTETSKEALPRMERIHEFVNNDPDKYQLVLYVEDLYKAKAEGKFAIIAHSQSTDMLDEEISLVEQ